MAGGLLGIDLGTSSAKALLVDQGGRVLGRGASEYPTRHPRPGFAEQDPEDWWRATVAAVRQALSAAGDVTVVAIGCSGQMHGTVLLDESGEVVAPAIIWADVRSARQVAEITATIGAKRLIEITGSPLATGFQAATVRWVQEERPELWRRVRTILLPKDYLRWRLTGRFATDPSDASSTLLLDLRTRDWSDEVIDALGIGREHLPPVLPSTAPAGELRPAPAVELGLAEGVPVVTGGGDAPCGAIGAGIVDSDLMLLTISTGAQVLVPVHEVRVDPRGRIHTFCSALAADPGRAAWYEMGATMVAGLAMRWLRDQVFGLDAEDAYPRMTSWAAEVPAGAGGLIFLPYLTGERTPHMNPKARGVLLGLTADHGRGHLVRAVMEGTTLALFDAYDVLASLGAAPRRIVLAGGGSQSGLGRQIVADVFGLAVRPLATIEQSALGAALLAGAGIGLFDTATAARKWAAHGEPVEPNKDSHAVYQQLLPIFRESYVKHRSDFDVLAAIGDGVSARSSPR